MAFSLHDYFQNQGLRLIEAALKNIVGKPAVYVEQEDHYRQTVIQPAWQALSPAVRLMLRSGHEDWVELFFQMRPKVFDLRSTRVDLWPDATAQLRLLLRRFYPKQGQPAPASAPDVPLAHPVEPPLSPTLPVSPPSFQADSSTEAQVEEATFVPDPEPPAQHEIVVGIDLGTTYSLVAHVDAHGRPLCIPNAQGDLLTPSAVLFEDDGSIIGKEALRASLAEPDKVAECFKRDMGEKFYRKTVHGEQFPPEVLSSLVLRSLKADAERKLGHPISKAVITVPAYFEETRRRATMDAGKLAGLEVLDILNEPTAAAIAYGYQLGFLDRSGKLLSEQPLRVLVFDLGGGTFDVTIVEMRGTDFKALATDGDVQLGGKDWDEQLVKLAAERFLHQTGSDPRENPYTLQELWLSAETAKRTLTERKKAALHMNLPGNRLKVEITREEFEEATAPLVERTRLTTGVVLRHTGLSWNDIDRVLLVGGSTRMPMIRNMLRELTGKEPDCSIPADEAVAHGAALYAELLAPRPQQQAPRFRITNVNSHSLGILAKSLKRKRRVNKILIPRNSPLPQTVTKVFKTFRAGQKSVAIKVLEGESDHPEVCTLIGTCVIRDLPDDLPAGWPVRVRYTYETNGRLRVEARLKGHKASVSAEFERENRLPEEDLELWSHFAQSQLRENS